MIGKILLWLDFRRYVTPLLAAGIFVGCSMTTIAPMNNLPELAPARSVDVDGIAINYTSSATAPQDVTLVLIHGFGASLETWHDIYPTLSTRYPVVRLDLKGHGFSSKPQDEKYSLAEQARLVMAFINKLGLKRVVLVGHSLGGGVALLTYLQHQDKNTSLEIVGLVLIDSAGYPQQLPFFVTTIRNPITSFFAYLMSPERRAQLLLERIVSVKSRVTAERIHRYAYFFDLPGSRNALKQTARYIVPSNVDELVGRFKQILVPTQIIWGEQDSVVPVENAYRFNNDIRNSKLTVLPQTGHIPHEERPNQVLEALGEFIKVVQ